MTETKKTSGGFLPNRALAVNVGKGVRWLSRRLGRGGGTSLPGLLAEKIDPSVLPSLAAAMPNGNVLITGTNGKTTTTRLLAAALRSNGLTPITNREGSNLLRGLATTLLSYSDALGNLHVPENAIGVLEIDEGALPEVVKVIEPRLIVFTNLFRDQLDRYFEVDYVAHLWSQALKQVPPTVPLVLNADDPQIAYLGEGVDNPIIYYGLEDMRHGQPGMEHISDARRCLRCGTDLPYSDTFYAHLGHYACGKCGWRRPKPKVSAWKVEMQGLEGSEVDASTPWGDQHFQVPLAGLYNVYNVLAAATAAFVLGVDTGSVKEATAQVGAAFGRMERFEVNGKQVCIALVKNPTGYNETLRLLLSDREPKGLLLALNDAIQDGRDVSWTWDVEFELCRDRTRFIIVTGTRAQDMALRLKYAEILESAAGDGLGPHLMVESDILKAFWEGLERTPSGGTLYVVPTYTAMWTLREELARKGYIDPFWQH